MARREPAPPEPKPRKPSLLDRRRVRKGKPAREGPGAAERIKQSYTIGRKHEPLILLWPIGAFVALVALGVALGFALGQLIILPVLGVLLGALAAMNVFFWRAQKGIYTEAQDRPGVALQVIRGMRGDWKITEAVQFNKNQEFVHRVVGRPGVVLVAEGRSQNVRNLLASEARRTRRIAPDVSVHELIVGPREGEVPLGKLRSRLAKLPRALNKPAVRALDVRLKAVANTTMPIPKGPMPTRMPRGKQTQRGGGRR